MLYLSIILSKHLNRVGNETAAILFTPRGHHLELDDRFLFLALAAPSGPNLNLKFELAERSTMLPPLKRSFAFAWPSLAPEISLHIFFKNLLKYNFPISSLIGRTTSHGEIPFTHFMGQGLDWMNQYLEIAGHWAMY